MRVNEITNNTDLNDLKDNSRAEADLVEMVNKLYGEAGGTLPVPKSRMEFLLHAIYEKLGEGGGGGSVDPADIETVVRAWFEEHSEAVATGFNVEFVDDGIEFTNDQMSVEEAVAEYLDDHPEATTTVQDGTISYAKLDSNLKAKADDVSELKSQVDNIEKPFNIYNLTGNSKLAASVFSAFEIHCADPSADVKLKRVLKQASNVYAIQFSINGTDYMALNQAISSYTEPAYNSFFINENLYGYYIIDWDALTAGTAYNNINAELKQENIQPLGIVDYIDEPFNIYNLTGNSKLAAGAFSAFEIHCADPSVQVKLTRVLRANSNVHAVIITVNGTSYNALNVLSANYTEPSYNAFNLSNVVYGYFIIDWSKLTSGTAYNNINAELKQENIKPYIETPKYQNVEILLPSTINVAVGHEISLEYYNIICCSDIDEYEIQATPNNTSFQNLGDRFRINPASAGNTTVTVSAYKNAVLIATKQTVVHAVADTQPTIKALFLGDSMTNQGIFLAELKRMLGANLNLYGTRSATAEDSVGNTQTVLNEGRPGWSTSDYVGLASKGGVTNPFYNNGFDFSYYMSNNPSFNDVTDVFILLGTNDGAGANIMSRYTEICNSIKNYSSNIRVHCLLPIPNINSGYAWGTRNYNNWLTFKNYMFNTAKKIINEYDGTAGYYIVPVNANINCYYDFPQTEVAVNNRNPQLIAVGNDNVHPSKYGYYRFADVIYADIIANCQ